MAHNHTSLLGGLGDRRPRARSHPWISPPGSALCSTSRKAEEVKGIKEGDDVRGPLASERKETMAPGSSWSGRVVGPACEAVGEVDQPAGLD
jgi:hypothetical protein